MAILPDDVNTALGANAVGPKSFTVGPETVVSNAIDDQIKAANHLAGVNASKRPGLGLRFSKIIPPRGG
jgi:hypothetical protein